MSTVLLEKKLHLGAKNVNSIDGKETAKTHGGHAFVTDSFFSFFQFHNRIVPWEIWVAFPGESPLHRIVLPNPLCMLGVGVFP